MENCEEKIVKAVYETPYSIFKIPKGIDLNNESIVKFWEVRWNTLCIVLVKDNEIMEIEPTIHYEDTMEIKRPDYCDILNVNPETFGI